MYKKSHRKLIIIFLGTAIVGLIAAVFVFRKKTAVAFETVAVAKTDVVLEVTSTGRVRPAETTELSFESGGRVKSIAKKVGQRVSAGEVLMQVGNSEMYAQKAQAEASFHAAEAELDLFQRGMRREEHAVKQVVLENAEVARSRAQTQVSTVYRDAYVRADDAVRNKADGLFSNPRTKDPVLTTTVKDTALRNEIEQKRVVAEQALAELDAGTNVVLNLAKIGTFLDRLAFSINDNVSPDTVISQMTIESWRADMASARGSLSAAVANVTSAEQARTSAESGVRLAQSEIALANVGTDPETIRVQKAKIEGAKAQVDALVAQIEKTVIRAPMSGVITKEDIRVGESASPFVPVVTLISDTQYEIETFVPEADISFVKVGLSVSVTLDAYTLKDIFHAKVVKIDPAETLIEGVATYKVTLAFDKKDNRIRPGMTANSTIESDKRTGVLAVPIRALILRDGKEFVRIARDERFTEMAVETGLRGSDGMVEILAGVAEGDKVVTFIKDESSSL